MTTPKTRFLISQKQTEKQIFSVEERRSGDLLIGFTPPKTIKIAGRITEKPKSRKVSVHVSPMSDPPVHTITHEIGFGLRAPHKGYAVVRRLENQPFIWPISCQSFGTYEPKFIHRRKSDEIRRIGAYDSNIDSLLVGIFVTDSSYTIPESHGLSVTVKRFSKFNLNVITTFADVKSGKSTLEKFNYTSPVKDGNFLAKIGGNAAADTFNIEGLESYLMNAFLDLANRTFYSSSPLIILPKPRHIQMRRFGRYPDGISPDEALYGEHSIAGSKRHLPYQRMDPADAISIEFANYSDQTPYKLIDEIAD